MSPSRVYRKYPYKPKQKAPLGYSYKYKQLRDIPVSQLSEDQFNYVVKSILNAAMGKYSKKRRSRKYTSSNTRSSHY